MPLTDFAVVKKHFSEADPKIVPVLETINLNEWFEKREIDDHFFNLARNIIYQQLAGKAASTIFGRFQTLVGEVVPERVVGFPDQAFRDVGLSWAKAKYVKDLASKTISGEVVLTNLHALSDTEVIKELTKVKGIGQWTAEMFLLFTLHREDIFSYGDLGLRNGFAKLYGIEKPSNDDMKKVVDRWTPYASYGSISLWHYLDNR